MCTGPTFDQRIWDPFEPDPCEGSSPDLPPRSSNHRYLQKSKNRIYKFIFLFAKIILIIYDKQNYDLPPAPAAILKWLFYLQLPTFWYEQMALVLSIRFSKNFSEFGLNFQISEKCHFKIAYKKSSEFCPQAARKLVKKFVRFFRENWRSQNLRTFSKSLLIMQNFGASSWSEFWEFFSKEFR